MQGLMWRSYNDMGFLEYSFVESVMAMKPFYAIRVMGGVLYLAGALVMVYNFYRTIKGDISESEPIEEGNNNEDKSSASDTTDIQGAVAT